MSKFHWRRFGLYALAALYLLAGLNHFRVPSFYIPLMPPYFPRPELWVTLSGCAEILLGIAVLVPRTRAYAARGIVLMLLVFMTVHVYMLQERHGKFAEVPELLLWARIPLQALLISWAGIYV